MDLNKVYCCDCMEGLTSIGAASVDLIVTDPPYNTGMDSDSNKTTETGDRVRLNNFFDDNYTDYDYKRLVRDWASEMERVLKPNKAAYIFINFKSYPVWYESLIKAGFQIKNCIVWDKIVHGLNYQNYAYTHEFIIFAVKGDFKLVKKTDFYKDVWHLSRCLGSELAEFDSHETIKPLPLIREIITQASKEGDIVLDMFAGTGTTLLAAKQLNRSYIGFEIMPKYYDIILKRLQQTMLTDLEAKS